MPSTITLSEEQVNQAIHYDLTKSITSACNLAQSIASMVTEALERIADNLEEVNEKLDD